MFTSRDNTAHHVVVVGGGFGGLYAAKVLSRHNVRVTIIDRRNFHLFQPLLYQVATGALSPGDIASPIRAVFKRRKNVRTIQAEVVGFDARDHKVILKDGEVPYDSLIVASGAKYSYFGNDNWERLAPGLKTLEDAVEIRRRVFLAFEAAEREKDTQKREAWMTYVIVGGGPTGVELAGALAELAHGTLKGNFRHIKPENARILLVEGGDQLLNSYSEKSSIRTLKDLQEMGVTVKLNARVTQVDEDRVRIMGRDSDEIVYTQTVLWAAGVKASYLGEKLGEATGAPLDRLGRVMVNRYCALPNEPNIYVVGDLSNFKPEESENPLPGVATVALQQGQYVGRQIIKKLGGHDVEGFVYKDKGSLAIIGRNKAVADLKRGRLAGFPAWLVWALVHIRYLVEFDNRLLVMIQWAFHYVTKRRGARLITTGECWSPEKSKGSDTMSQKDPREQPLLSAKGADDNVTADRAKHEIVPDLHPAEHGKG